MGTATGDQGAELNDTQRSILGRAALRDGTAARIRDLRGWNVEDMARHCNVAPHVLACWEDGTQHPTPAKALKVWQVLVTACLTPEDTP